MKKGRDIAVQLPGLYLVHHNLPGKKVALHSHADPILFLPLQGEIEISLSDRLLKAGVGRAVFLPANTEHSFNSSSLLGERLIAIFNNKLWKKFSANDSQGKTIPLPQLCKEILFYLLLNPKSKNTKSLIEVLIQVLSESILESHSLLEGEHLSANIKDERLKKAFELIEENQTEKINLDSIAKKAGLSQRSLNRLSVEELGVTPIQFLTHLRIKNAVELLTYGKTVTEVAYEVGYQSLSQFISTFQKLTGQLPSEVIKIGKVSKPQT